jgi:hypothetical protein
VSALRQKLRARFSQPRRARTPERAGE